MVNSIPSNEPISEAEALERLSQQDDPSLQCYGAWWLGRMRSSHPEAIPLLLNCLSRQLNSIHLEPDELAVGRSAARSLGKLQAEAALPLLLQALNHPDHGLRDAAARSLGELGNPAAIAALMGRLQQPLAGEPVGNGLNLAEPCEALLEAIGQIYLVSGVKASAQSTRTLEAFQCHSRPLVASAASRALLQLSGKAKWAEPMVALLQHPQLQTRRAALMDLAACGWRPAAEAISGCSAENSLKLIALRRLVEEPLGEPHPGALGAREKELLALMDGLL